MGNSIFITIIAVLLVVIAVMGSSVFTGQVINDPVDNSVSACTESWTCSDWSECTDSQQARKCTDQNACGTTDSKSPEQQACEMPKEWQLVKRYADETDRAFSRDPFLVSGEWRIIWYCSDQAGYENIGKGHAVVNVYRDGENTSIASLLGICEFDQQEEALFEESGWFYIKVQALDLNFWSVRIEEATN